MTGCDAVKVAPYTFGHPVFPRALAEAPAARATESLRNLTPVWGAAGDRT